MKTDHHTRRTPLLCLSSLMTSAFLVTACGGGDGGPESPPSAAQEAAAALLESDSHDDASQDDGPTEKASAASTTTWVKVADEGHWFTVDKPVLVRFGAGSAWVYKVVESGGTCSHGFFGEDPAPTVHETCQKQVSAAAPPAPAPSPAPSPSPAPPPSAGHGSAHLAWKASASPGVSGYRIYFGSASRAYAQAPGNGINVGNRTSYTLSGLGSGQRIYFTVTAVDASGRESPYANEGSKVIP